MSKTVLVQRILLHLLPVNKTFDYRSGYWGKKDYLTKYLVKKHRASLGSNWVKNFFSPLPSLNSPCFCYMLHSSIPNPFDEVRNNAGHLGCMYLFFSTPAWVYRGTQSLCGVAALVWAAHDPQSLQGCAGSGTGHFFPWVRPQPHLLQGHQPCVLSS